MKAPSPRDAASRTALEHEVRDDAVELGALVVERLAALAHALLARAQGSKVLDGLRHDVAVEAHDDAARGRAADGDVEEDLRACACGALIGVRLLLLESMRVAASRASDGRIPRELMRLDASRAPDGRDSWKVTAVQTLDLCLVGDLGLGCCHSGDRSGEKGETRHDLVQC